MTEEIDLLSKKRLDLEIVSMPETQYYKRYQNFILRYDGCHGSVPPSYQIRTARWIKFNKCCIY